MPIAKPLRAGIYELRARAGTVNYRILYFFHGRNVAVISQGLTKEGVVPANLINRAIEHKQLVESDPLTHTIEFEL